MSDRAIEIESISIDENLLHAALLFAENWSFEPENNIVINERYPNGIHTENLREYDLHALAFQLKTQIDRSDYRVHEYPDKTIISRGAKYLAYVVDKGSRTVNTLTAVVTFMRSL